MKSSHKFLSSLLRYSLALVLIKKFLSSNDKNNSRRDPSSTRILSLSQEYICEANLVSQVPNNWKVFGIFLKSAKIRLHMNFTSLMHIIIISHVNNLPTSAMRRLQPCSSTRYVRTLCTTVPYIRTYICMVVWDISSISLSSSCSLAVVYPTDSF